MANSSALNQRIPGTDMSYAMCHYVLLGEYKDTYGDMSVDVSKIGPSFK